MGAGVAQCAAAPGGRVQLGGRRRGRSPPSARRPPSGAGRGAGPRGAGPAGGGGTHLRCHVTGPPTVLFGHCFPRRGVVPDEGGLPCLLCSDTARGKRQETLLQSCKVARQSCCKGKALAGKRRVSLHCRFPLQSQPLCPVAQGCRPVEFDVAAVAAKCPQHFGAVNVARWFEKHRNWSTGAGLEKKAAS